ncbi:MAG: starch synthase [Kosmotogales bacterium]|nr:starch synthase [Kosmotogales bacterium]
MKTLFCSYEVYPFAKVGGLADVAGSLPKYIKEMGADIDVIMPFHKKIDINVTENTGMKICTGRIDRKIEFDIYKSHLENSDVTVYFLKNDELFDSEDVYEGGDIFLKTLSISEIMAIFCEENEYDLLHLNDWHVGMASVYNYYFYGRIPTLFSIHNMAYQGVFPADKFSVTGLPREAFPKIVKDDQINFMKGALMFSNAINTVSESYAKEIKTPEFGAGLEDILIKRNDDLYGILNGIDYKINDPDTDKRIPKNFSVDDLSGKYECKKALQKRCDLKIEDVPLFGLISRLFYQKGLDLLQEIVEEFMNENVQFVILGNGDKKIEDFFLKMQNKFKGKFSSNIMFDINLAQEIYAGCDFFVMPSRYEPCGLGQMFAMRYGTVPVVRYTGGLIDSVKEYDETDKTGTGFGFYDYNSEKLLEVLNKAKKIFYREDFDIMRKNCMEEDFSWNNSAKKYIDLYNRYIR